VGENLCEQLDNDLIISNIEP